jgi:hypothetical protein
VTVPDRIAAMLTESWGGGVNATGAWMAAIKENAQHEERRRWWRRQGPWNRYGKKRRAT